MRTTLAALLALLPHLAQAADVQHQRGTLTLSNGHYRVALETRDGLGWREIWNSGVGEGASPEMLAIDAPSRLFEITIIDPDGSEPIRMDSLDFTVAGVRKSGGECRLKLTAQAGETALGLGLTILADDSHQSRWIWTLQSSRPVRADFVFPIIEGIAPGDDLRDVGYFFPRDPGLMNDIPIRLQTNYGQYATSQLVSVFNERWGGGLYSIWQDTSLHRKSFELVKADPDGPEPVELLDEYGFPFWRGLEVERGVGLASMLPNIALAAGEPVELAPLALGIHAGAWREAFRDYRAWVDTWYRPDHPEKLSGFYTFTGYHSPGCAFWAVDSADEAIDGIPERVDQLHFIAQKVDRYGAYDHYREDWGLDGLQRFIRAAQARGKLTSHYFQGQVAHDTSDVFREHGDEWGQKQPDGENAMAWANQCMCYSAEGWREWLATTTSRAVRDLGLDIVYLDCVGWTTGEKFVCHNENHEHPPEYHRLTSVRELFHTVEEAIRREDSGVALTTEGPVADLFFNDVDGNEGYGVSFFQSEAYGPPVHFMRFLYPRFKYLDLQTTSADKTGQALFTATATDADPETLPLASVAHRVFHENVETFTRGAATPHLPTREPGVFCNRFASEGKAVYTVWNDNTYAVAGASVPVDVPDEWHVVDVMRHREGITRRADGLECLVVDLEARSPGVYAVVPETIRVDIEGMWLRIDWGAIPEEAEFRAVLLDDADAAADEVTLDRAAGMVDLVALTSSGRYRPALALLGEGRMIDLMELPALDEIDIAGGAAVSCSNPNYEHGAKPGSVVGQAGSWKFQWDDEPRPGWIQLDWPRPQTFNAVEMQFSRGHYSSRECEVMVSADGDAWETVARGTSDDVSGARFAPVTASALRVVFHQGGEWANLVSLTRLRVVHTRDEDTP